MAAFASSVSISFESFIPCVSETHPRRKFVLPCSSCPSRHLVQRRTIRSEVSLVDAVKHALKAEFKNKNVERVVASFSNAVSGNVLDKNDGTPRHQHATSFISGLDAVPFIDHRSGDYSWVQHLEDNWTRIRDEFVSITAQDDLAEKGNNVWVPPVVEAANTYGPDWRTLVLQDRVWDPINSKLFPTTTKILQDQNAQVPSVEAFFARQTPNTGIKLHTDYCNFILTMHLGLTVPFQQSWIEVGGERRYWEEGKALVFNTSFYHQTMNESTEEDRSVLLIRFWHPQLTKVERQALQFLFELIDNPEQHPSVIRAKAVIEKGSSASTHDRRSSTSSRGFGK